MYLSSQTITLDGYVARQVEEKTNSQGQPLAYFTLIVHMPGKKGQETKRTYNICVKGQSYLYVTGKFDPANKVEVGDRVVVRGEFDPHLNDDMMLFMIDQALAQNEAKNDAKVKELLTLQREIITSGYSPGDKSRPLIFQNVYVSSYGHFVQVVCRRSRTRLSDALRESGVRGRFHDKTDAEFEQLTVMSMGVVADFLYGPVPGAPPPAIKGIGPTVDASLLVEAIRQRLMQENNANKTQTAKKSRMSDNFHIDNIPI